MYKYTVEVWPEYNYSRKYPAYRLILRAVCNGQKFTAERTVYQDEVQHVSIFDLVFDDLKDELKRVMRKEML